MTNQEALNDFRRRYEHTYVWLSMEQLKKETLVHIDRVEDSSSKIGVLHLNSEEYGQLTVNFGSSDHSLKFKYPPVGVFQHGNDAFVFTRRPARQYRRGLCSDNSTMVNVARTYVGNHAAWTASEVLSAHKHETFSKEAALEMLAQKRMRGVALPDNYSLIKSFDKSSKDHFLFAWSYPVARISPEKGTITKLLEPEYEKEVYRLGIMA